MRPVCCCLYQREEEQLLTSPSSPLSPLAINKRFSSLNLNPKGRGGVRQGEVSLLVPRIYQASRYTAVRRAASKSIRLPYIQRQVSSGFRLNNNSSNNSTSIEHASAHINKRACAPLPMSAPRQRCCRYDDCCCSRGSSERFFHLRRRQQQE